MAGISIFSQNKLNELVEKSIDATWSFLAVLVSIVLLSLIGYVIGYVFSIILKRVLLIDHLQVKLIKYGASTSSMWESIVEFLAASTKWLMVFAFLSFVPEFAGQFSGSTFQLSFFVDLYLFFLNIYLFVVLAIFGILLGGIFFKLLKDAFVTFGLEEGLKKYKVSDSFAGVPVSDILATIGKWFVVVIFIDTGLHILFKGPGTTFNFEQTIPLTTIMDGLMAYIPFAILGFLVILASLIFANLVGNRIRYEKVPFADILATVFEMVVIFFGIVLALPQFGIKDVSILADSFKIIMVGVALGLAIAIGFGLKESVSKMAEKMK